MFDPKMPFFIGNRSVTKLYLIFLILIYHKIFLQHYIGSLDWRKIMKCVFLFLRCNFLLAAFCDIFYITFPCDVSTCIIFQLTGHEY